MATSPPTTRNVAPYSGERPSGRSGSRRPRAAREDPDVISEPLDAAGVEAVAAIADPVLRNLWITQSYFGLNTRLQHAVGGADRTWCGFAVWASDTAGQSIRGEELPHLVVQLTDQLPEHARRHRQASTAGCGRCAPCAASEPVVRRPAAATSCARPSPTSASTSPTATRSSTASSVRCSWRSSSGARPATRRRSPSDEVQQLLQAARRRTARSRARQGVRVVADGGRRRPTTRRGRSPSSPPTCSPSPTSSGGCSRTSRRR